MSGRRRDKGRGGDETNGPSVDDKELWRRVTETARPLRGRPATPKPESGPPQPKPQPKKKARLPHAEPAPPLRKKAPPPELAAGSVAGVARSQVERLRRGRLPIEARLDLHGYTQEHAHRELDAFLARAQSSGKRCVLIVTGKGLSRDEGGVLRRMVPLWLNQPPNRDRILAFDVAQPKDGGMGALYVLLKRARKT